MVTRPVQATAAFACLLLIATANSASAQSDYLVPIPAPAGSTCGDTASDCAAICNTHRGSEEACQSSSRIGNYLRCTLLQQYPVCLVPADLHPAMQGELQEHLWRMWQPLNSPFSLHYSRRPITFTRNSAATSIWIKVWHLESKPMHLLLCGHSSTRQSIYLC